MAMAGDGRISLSAAARLRGATGLAGRNWGIVKFCNGEMMGKKMKVKLSQFQKGSGHGGSNNVKQHVCMSLTTNVAGELKVSFLKHSHTGLRSSHIAHKEKT
jgi:glucose-1-phosphate adenylyltransferase